MSDGMPVWKLRLLGVVLTVVVMQYLSDMGSELRWRRERTVLRNRRPWVDVAAMESVESVGSVESVRRSANLPFPTVPYAVPYAVPVGGGVNSSSWWESGFV